MVADSSRLEAAVIDGRAITTRFRQRQLTELHKAIATAEGQLVEAVRTDCDCSQVEAQIQHRLTLESIKQYYSAIDFEKSLDDEYNVAHSKDNASRRAPFGYTYIIPCSHDVLYSSVTALAAGIAAGNCVVLELGQTTSRLTPVIRSVLTQALDSETLLITEKDTFSDDFKSRYCVQLDLRPSASALSMSKSIATPLARTVAVVDRTANLSSAAKELVRARFGFGGRSAYAPDVVLVNEYALKDFASAVAQHALGFLTGNIQINGSLTANGHVSGSYPVSKKSSSLMTQVDKDPSATIIASGARGSVVLVNDRNSIILQASSDVKVSEPVLVIHPTTSMDDAIDFLNTTYARTSPLLAVHLFANPASAKYLSQFIHASSSFSNSVPVELLIGPPAPQGFPTATHPRFSIEMFSLSRPEQISISPRNAFLAEVLDRNEELGRVVGKGRTEKSPLDVSLKPTNEPEGGAIGFFEQGILVGGSILLTTVGTAIYLATSYGLIPAARKAWGWRR